MDEDQDKYIKFLSDLYLKSPGIVLTAITGNTTYEKVAGDKATIKIFKSLYPLCTGACAKRKDTWWRKRHSILGKLHKKKIINLEEFKRFATERRSL